MLGNAFAENRTAESKALSTIFAAALSLLEAFSLPGSRHGLDDPSGAARHAGQLADGPAAALQFNKVRHAMHSLFGVLPKLRSRHVFLLSTLTALKATACNYIRSDPFFFYGTQLQRQVPQPALFF